MADEPIVLDWLASQITLYAKGCYQQTDAVKDLQVIVGHICEMPPSYIKPKVIFENVMDTFRILSEQEPHRRTIFWREIFPKHLLKTERVSISLNEMMAYLLEFIADTLVVDITGRILIKTEDPNYNMLPRADEDEF